MTESILSKQLRRAEFSFYYLDGKFYDWWQEKPIQIPKSEQALLKTVMMLLDVVDLIDGALGEQAEIPGVGYWWESYVGSGVKVKAYAVEKKYFKELKGAAHETTNA